MRSSIRLAVISGAAATLLLGTVASGSASADSNGTRATGSLSSALDLLPVVPQIDNGYTYAGFATPAVKGKDTRGCGKDQRVLIASASSKPRVGAGCSLIGGTWLVDQGKRTVRGARNVDVVPLISAKTAWNQGAYGWSNAQRRSFLTWYQKAPQECAIGAGGQSGPSCGYVLQSKAGLNAQITDLTTQPVWRPTCAEAAGVVSILSSWGLSVEPTAAAKMQSIADGCSAKVQTKALNKINPVPPTTAGNPFMSGSAALKPWSTTNVLDAPAGPAVSSELFGLHVPDIKGAAPELAYSWLRLWDSKTGWEPLEQNRGTYYWKWIDDAVAYAEANGKRVIYVFGDTPGWAGPSPTYPPSDINEFRRYAKAVISRYGNRIAAYEIWNEPNLNADGVAMLSDLVEMTQIVHSEIKGAGLSSLVLTPSTTMRTGTAVYPFFSKYLVKLAEVGWPIDGYTFHTYPRAAGGPAERTHAIALFKEMLALAKAPDKPIWDTEINYGLAGLREAKREITGAEAQGYVAQTFIDSVRFGVSQVDWYLWFSTYFPLLGIQTNPSTTSTNTAWAWTRAVLIGASLHACANEGPAVVCGFSRAGAPFGIAFSSTGEAVSVSVPDDFTQQCDMDGRCTPISGGKVTVGIRPLKLS